MDQEKRLVQLSWIPNKQIDIDRECDMCVLFHNSPCSKQFDSFVNSKSEEEFEVVKSCLNENKQLFDERQEEIHQKIQPYFPSVADE